MTKTLRRYAEIQEPPIETWRDLKRWCQEHPKECGYFLAVHVCAGLWWYFVMGLGSVLQRL